MSFFDWFGIGKSEVDEYRIKKIPLSQIVSNPFQPRSFIDENALEELAGSIEQYGVITPIIVTPTDKGQYQLVAGERRVRASRKIGRSQIPAVVRDYTDEELVEVSFLENLQRESMNEIDKAEMYERLRSEFKNLSIEELSDLIGKPVEEIQKRKWMLELPLITKRALANDVIDERWAKMLTEIDEEHHREIILHIAEDDPAPQEIVDKMQEFNPEVTPRKKEFFDRSIEFSDDIVQIIEKFGEELEKLYRNGNAKLNNGDNTQNTGPEKSDGDSDQSSNASLTGDEELPEEIQDRN